MTDLWKDKVTIYNDIPANGKEQRRFDRFVVDKCSVQGGFDDKTTDTAIRQIKDKRYTGALSGYHEKILLVGINYDPDNKSHSCDIEEWENRSE